MASLDRTLFLSFAQQYFLSLREGNWSSDDIHAFMNETLGMGVPLDAPNGNAFDQWRKAMQAQGYDAAWAVSAEQEAIIKARGASLLAQEEERVATQEITLEDGSKTTLAALKEKAPNVPAGELLRQAEEALKRARR